MAKIYERVNWEDLPSKNTPINAENLNKMDEAIDKLDDKIVELEESGSGNYLEKENPSGTGSFSMNRKAGSEIGDCSVAVGCNCEASKYCSYAEGNYTVSNGGYGSHAEGSSTTADGLSSHAEGEYSKSSGNYSHAEGKITTSTGYASHAEGFYTTASGEYSHAEGERTTASGNCSHAEGLGAITEQPSGEYVVITNAKGLGSHVEGVCTIADGEGSHAEGWRTKAIGIYGSHAEGRETVANGFSSHAEGYDTLASDSFSHAEGWGVEANGQVSHAEGCGSVANGFYSHVEGYYAIASGESQHVQGKYNAEDTENKYAHIVGGGTSLTNRKNIHTLDWEGNAEFAGDVTNGNGVSLNGLKTLVEEKTNTNDMTLAYTEAEELTELTSGEKLTVAFGKLAKAVKDFISHLADKVAHITSEERNLWNTVSNKADKEHAHNYAGSSSVGGSADSAEALSSTTYIDGLPFDGTGNVNRLGTCTTVSNDTAKEVTIEGFEEIEECADAILYIQFTSSDNGSSNDAHTICINNGEQLVIYYKDEVLDWELYFSRYPFCEGQIHQFRYHYNSMGSRLELIAVENRAVANNLTTTNEKIALAAPMGKQLAENYETLKNRVDTISSNLGSIKLVENFKLETGVPYEITGLKGAYILVSFQGGAVATIGGIGFLMVSDYTSGGGYHPMAGGDAFKKITAEISSNTVKFNNSTGFDTWCKLYKIY